MADEDMATGGGVQGCECTHHLDVGNPNRVVFMDILQLYTRPVVRELITKQRH